MLTSFTFCNLGEFQERQDLKFHEVKNDGKGKGRLGILVGTNDTGKSSCFEFLRRCMSAEINHTNSGICNYKNSAWALAQFQIDKKTLYEHVGQRLMKNVFDDLNNLDTDKLNIWTGVMFKGGYKINVIQLDGDNNEWYKAITEATSLTEGKHSTNERSSGGLSVTYHSYDGPVVKDGKFMRNIQSSEELSQEVFEEVHSSLFGVNGLVTFVFDQRGIGAVTSTRSLKSHEVSGQKNYDCTQERAKMITEMVKKVDEQEQKRTDFDLRLAKLTATKDFTFKVEGDELKVFKVGSPNAPDQPLKVPSGILGSCHIALFLTLAKDYTTLVIDEPSLGMHPDMITRIREELVDVVHKENVSIILSTHAEQFVSHDTLHNVFRFNRNAENGFLSCRYLPVQRISQLKGYQIDEIRGWLFSSWLIIVEGVTDAILIGAIVKKFSSIKGADPKYLRLANAKIVKADGSTKIQVLCSIFKSIGAKVCCVYDADADKKRKKLGFWVTENILNYSKRSERVVNHDQGKKIARNIRQLLNTTYHFTEGAEVNEFTSFMCEKLVLGTLQKSLQEGQLMIYYLLEETKRCEHKKREAFCESLKFALQQTKYVSANIAELLPMYKTEGVSGDLKAFIGKKEMKHETVSMDEVKHLVVLESLFRPVWDSTKNENIPSDCDDKYMEAETKTFEYKGNTQTTDTFPQGQCKTSQDEAACAVTVPNDNTTQPEGKSPQPGGNMPQKSTFFEDESTFPHVDGKTSLAEDKHQTGVDDKSLKTDGTTNQVVLKIHAEDRFYWNCGCIEDFVNVTLRKRFLTDTKLEPWTYRKSLVGTGQDQKGSPRLKTECLWYCQKKSPGSIDNLSWREINELAHLILQDSDVNPYLKDFEKFLLKHIGD